MNEQAATDDGVALIAAERQRQVESEGYTAEHDAQYEHMQLAQAASAYALGGAAFLWPWDMVSFKPTRDPIRDLTKAGALIAAAIDAELQHRRLAEAHCSCDCGCEETAAHEDGTCSICWQDDVRW